MCGTNTPGSATVSRHNEAIATEACADAAKLSPPCRALGGIPLAAKSIADHTLAPLGWAGCRHGAAQRPQAAGALPDVLLYAGAWSLLPNHAARQSREPTELRWARVCERSPLRSALTSPAPTHACSGASMWPCAAKARCLEIGMSRSKASSMFLPSPPPLPRLPAAYCKRPCHACTLQHRACSGAGCRSVAGLLGQRVLCGPQYSDKIVGGRLPHMQGTLAELPASG